MTLSRFRIFREHEVSVMYDQTRLSNGLTIIGERLPHFRSVSVGVWIAAGSQYETREENGLSHFLEHMLFKGTEKRSARQIAEVMDAVGGQLNAFTAKECTCFYAKVIDEHTELALDVLSDMVLHSTFDETELNKEKGVVLEEIAMSEDEPEDVCGELIMSAQYGDQPLAWPILGPADNVKSFTRDRLIAYRDRMYRPECSVLAISGNYDWEKLVALAERYFGGWRRGEGACPQYVVQPAKPQSLRREKDIEQVHLSIGFPACAIGAPEVYPISIFNSVLGGAMSSRLFQRIREESGMAYSVYSYPSYYTATGMLVIYAGTSRQNAPAVMKMIDREVEQLVKEGITREEFEMTRTQIRGSYVLGLESASARMNALGRRMLLLGETQSEDEMLDKLNAVRWEDVNRIMREVLTSERSVATVEPKA